MTRRDGAGAGDRDTASLRSALVAGSPFAGLHVLADDDERWGRDPVSQARDACAGGAHVIQLRVKHASDGQALEWALAMRKLTHECGAAFVVNDRFDLALASGADAVHLGQTDLPPERIPAEVRSRLAVGFSTHSALQAEASRALSIDYVAYGPVFGTTSKQSEYDSRGVAALKRVAEIVAPRPLVAIGGIHAGNLLQVIEAGAAGAAVISAVASASDPAAAARELACHYPSAQARRAQQAKQVQQVRQVRQVQQVRQAGPAPQLGSELELESGEGES